MLCVVGIHVHNVAWEGTTPHTERQMHHSWALVFGGEYPDHGSEIWMKVVAVSLSNIDIPLVCRAFVGGNIIDLLGRMGRRR